MNNFEITIDRIEGDKVVIKTQENETAILPANFFKEKVEEGQVYFLSIKNLQDKERSCREQAKDILNEILEVE